MNQEKALQLWNDLYGDVDTAYDYASHLMRRSDFDNENSIVGWTVDYKKPLAQGGSMMDQNLIPCAFPTYRIREDRNAFTIGSHAFEVRKGRAYKTYELYDITDKSDPLCLDPFEMDQDPEYNRARKKDISSYGKTVGKNPAFSINDVYKKALKTALDDIDYKDEEQEQVPASDSISYENTMTQPAPVPSFNELVEEDKESEKAIQTEEVISEEKGEDKPNEVIAPVVREETETFDSEKAEEKKDDFVPELQEMEEETSSDEVILPESSFEEEKEVFDSEKTSEPTPAPLEENEEKDNDEVRELKLLIQKKDEEIVALNDRLSELDDIIANKERDGELAPDYERVDATEDEKEEVEEDLHDEEDLRRIQELEEELSKTQDELKKVSEDKLALESDKASLDSQVSSLNESLKEMEDVKVQNAEKDGEIYGLRSQLNSLLQENENLKKETEELRHDSASEEEKENGLLKEKEELQSKVNALEAEKKTSSEEKEQEMTSLKERIDLLEKNLASLAQEKESLTQEKENLLRENAAVLESKENLVAQTEEKAAFVLNLQNDIERIKEEKEKALLDLESVTAEKESFLKEKDDLKEEKQSLQERITALEEEKNQLVSSSQDTDSRIHALTLELESLKKEKEEVETEKMTLNASLQEKEQMIHDLEESKDTMSSKVDSLQADLNQEKEEKTKEIAGLKEANDVLTAKVSELQNVLDQEKESNTASVSSLNEELETLRKTKEEKETEIVSLQEKLLKAEEEKNTLTQRSEEVTSSNAEKDSRIAELEKELESLKAEEAELLAEKQATDSEKLTLAEEKKALEDQLKEKEVGYEGLENEYQNFTLSSNEQIEELNAEINAKEKENLILTSGGAPKFLKEILEAMKGEESFTSDSIHGVLNHHPEWKVKDDQEVSFVPEPVSVEEEGYVPLEAKVIGEDSEDLSYLRKEKEKAQNAFSYFDENYGVDCVTVSDFAGRYIRKDDYANKDSAYGWDYALLDENEPDTRNNIVIMNLKTLKDYTSKGEFTSNSHSYAVKENNGRKQVCSTDYVTDPFDYQSAVAVTMENEKKTTPLIYIMVKGLSPKGSDPDTKNLMTFFDLIDRTVSRCCPESFLEMKTSLGAKSDYAFLTFDGMAEGAYKEAIDYALVLNAYRQEFYKKGLINAVIVIGEVMTPFSLRHLSFEKLYSETKSLELFALRYEFMTSAVVDSTIKKTIHIGPSIIDKLPINQNATQESRLGSGNFAKAYGFKDVFKTYNYGYTLRSNSSENTDK